MVPIGLPAIISNVMSAYDNLSESQQFACRVIADHARATAFAIADGILPGNEGRNYVLRKIMRRAIYHGREHLGLNDLFFYKVCDFVVSEMKGAYPELETQRDFILKIVKSEEERFSNTLVTALQKLPNSLPAAEKKLKSDENAIVIDEISKQANRVVNLSLQAEAAVVAISNIDYAKVIAPLAINIADMNRVIAQQIAPLAQSVEQIRQSLEHSLAPTMNMLAQIGEAYRSNMLPQIAAMREAFAKIPAGQLSQISAIYDELENLAGVIESDSDESFQPIFHEFARLYDTYGAPRDLLRIALEERGYEISEERFNRLLDSSLKQLQLQSGIGKTERTSQLSPIYGEVLNKVGPTLFVGYEATRYEGAKVTAIIRGDVELLSLDEGEEGGVVLDTTPFYAESGGQVGDTGVLLTDQGTVIRVLDTFSPLQNLVIHKVKVEKGSIRPSGDDYLDVQTSNGIERLSADTQLVTAVVDAEKRDATRRNHTATHLVHAALREVLGTHVKQAGSVVGPSVLRFDFTHYQPMTAAEIAEVEDLVNRHILENHPVNTNVMAIEQAMAGGAMALFGEKYGSAVRVLSVGDGVFSKELCGGTHVRATGDIGVFKIMSDEAIASGVRRIRAITGFDAFERFRENELLIDRSLAALKTQRDNLPAAIERLQDELKRTRKEGDELKLKIALVPEGSGTVTSTASATGVGYAPPDGRDVAGVKVLAKIVDGLDANGQRQLSDTLLARLKSGIVILGRRDGGKVGIIVRVSNDLTSKVRAGDIIREIAPIVGGKGGGKADMAEGGGTEPSQLENAIDAAFKFIEQKMG